MLSSLRVDAEVLPFIIRVAVCTCWLDIRMSTRGLLEIQTPRSALARPELFGGAAAGATKRRQPRFLISKTLLSTGRLQRLYPTCHCDHGVGDDVSESRTGEHRIEGRPS